MSQKRKIGLALWMAFAWGIGWGGAWTAMAAYQESVTFGFLVKPASFYVTWNLVMLGILVVAFLITSTSTGLFVRLLNPAFTIWHFFGVVVIWETNAILSGIVGVNLYRFSHLGTDSLYFLGMLVYFLCLLPAGFSILGGIGGAGTTWMLKLVAAHVRGKHIFLSGLAWALAFALGGWVTALIPRFGGFIGGLFIGCGGFFITLKAASLPGNYSSLQQAEGQEKP